MTTISVIAQRHTIWFCLSLILLQLLTQQLTFTFSILSGIDPLEAKFAENAAGLVVVIIFARLLSHLTVGWFPRQSWWVYLLPALYICLNLFSDFYSHRPERWVLGLSNALMTGVLEEWLCRGLIFTLLWQTFSKQGSQYAPLKAIILSAILFGGAHLANIISEPEDWQAILAQCIYACMIGIGFASVYWYSGGLLPLVFIHAAINALDFATTPEYKPVTTVSSFADYIPVMLIFLPLAGFGLFLGLKKQDRAGNLLPKQQKAGRSS